MTFAALLSSPPPLAELRALWLVMPAELAAAMLAKQAALSTSHRVAPVVGPSLAEAAVCADLVSEVGPGGLYAPLFAALDAEQFGVVTVVPFAELTAAGWFAAPADSAL